MKILHFSASDLRGGAGKAAYHLHTALREAGHTSRMVVRHKDSHDRDVEQAHEYLWRARLKYLKHLIPLIGGPKAAYAFHFDVNPPIDSRIFYAVGMLGVDVIYLHWIRGLLTTRSINRIYAHYQSPLLWMLMDQEPITGGCHYSFGCDGFMRQCGNCPLLSTNRFHDRSNTVWRRKNRYLRPLPITFVAPTNWIAERAKQSSLFRDHRVEVIPLALNTRILPPLDPRTARHLLDLPQDKRILFFGASSLKYPRKGMAYLSEALHRLAYLMNDANGSAEGSVLLLVAGNDTEGFVDSLPFPSRSLGYLESDVALAHAYQAADVFVCPSIEDAGPMMIPESMLCGTPVVAFDTGGAPDLVVTGKTGYLAACEDSADLARGLFQVLSANEPASMRAAAHEAAAARHSPHLVAARHKALWASLLDGG